MKSMMDKKTLVLVLACTGLFSAASSANSANIDITGTVVASACVINGNNTSLAMNLGDSIAADSLATSGTTTAWASATLKVTGCPASTTSFSVTFTGDVDPTDANYYKNTGTATNLKLELTSESDALAYRNGIKLVNIPIDNSTHAYDLNMRARAMSKGIVMPGTIKGQVQATFTYQ
ncbi:fimbrial protein [Citrobacter sp. Res13-Sevr-PEB04-36]|uniref:fimbrial protein n=1 Tax=Citrobacter sp. Res13-Sevr-PEB04-36 TaxID=2777960 RepID=UPI0018AC91DA|nr:fimbrial protein [Citrobacter sp. Res13-Sevr-PEB04-36]